MAAAGNDTCRAGRTGVPPCREQIGAMSEGGRSVARWNRHGLGWPGPGLILVLLLVCGCAGIALAGTTGKLSGRVLDSKGQPVVGAALQIVDQKIGAFSDNDGYYNLVNVPPGLWDVRVSHVAFQPTVITGALVSADNTTRLDVRLRESALSLEAVEVKAERPLVEVNLTSTRATITDRDIATLPVQELQDVVNLQAGVIDGHFRGGRIGEVQFQVDGISVNNPFNNASSLRIDRSLLQEVQVISGVFDAEYGQAMSGVVNAVLKDGAAKFGWEAEVSDGGFIFPGDHRRQVSDRFQPTAQQNYQLSVSGPAGLPQTVFLVSGRRYLADDYLRAHRRFLPTDSSDFAGGTPLPTGDSLEAPLGYSREWSGVVKLTNTSIPRVKLSYQALFNRVDGRRGNFAYRFNPDGLSRQHTWAVAHGIDLAHTLSATTYYNLAFRQNYLDYSDMRYDDAMDHRYDDAGPAIGMGSYENGAVIQGVDFTRFAQNTNLLLFKGSVASQLNRRHMAKVGGEVTLPRVRFGVPGTLVYTTVNGQQGLVRHFNDPPDYPGVREYRPVSAAIFVQDQGEWTDLTVRAGLRFEYFDARSQVPGDPANPANSIAGSPPSHPRATSSKAVLAPRLGVAYPITDRAGVHFAYGHFYQFPALGEIFANADYSILARLQAGGISYGVLGNPDVRPERTVQYELGYKYAVSDRIGADLNVFYKDIRDLLGVEFVSTYNGAEYARMTNVDFGNVVGFTLALDQRQFELLSATLDYTWQLAEGNSSDPRETATRAEAGEDPRPRLVSLNWDQRHTFNLTAQLERPQTWSACLILRAVSGQPYSPILEAGFGNGLETNSGRKPAAMTVDLRAERYLGWSGRGLSIFARVFNAFNARYFNGMVFNSTGSPDYSRFPATDRNSLADPGRYYTPRRVEVGIKLASKG